MRVEGKPPAIDDIITDHGALSGLGDDDHTHYLNEARGEDQFNDLIAVYDFEQDANVLAAISNEIDEHVASGVHPATNVSVADVADYWTTDNAEGIFDEIGAGIAGFDADVTAVEDSLAAHLADPTAAHAATAISVDSTNLDGSSVTVQGALEELEEAIAATGAIGTHLSDPTDAHDASAISVVSTTLTGTGVDVQAVLEELDNLLDTTVTGLSDHLADTSDAHDASAISILDAANDFTATDVEGALAEIQTDIETIQSSGAPPSGSAGGALDGTYPNPGLAASVAGAALAETSNVLDVQVDGTGIEISSDALRLKDSGVATAKVAAKAITPAKLSEHEVQIQVTDPNGSALTTGDGKAYFAVPTRLNGLDLIGCYAVVTTVSSSGLPTVQIANVTDSVDMLSTKLSIDASEFTSFTATTAVGIDTSHDDVATGDILRIDIDVAGTGAKGLIVGLIFG